MEGGGLRFSGFVPKPDSLGSGNRLITLTGGRSRAALLDNNIIGLRRL